MKKGLKYGGIWIAGVIMITMVVNLLASLFVRYAIYGAMLDFTKYVREGEAFLYPGKYVKTLEEPDKIYPRLKLRSMLSDNYVEFNQGIKGDLTCTSIRIDSAITFSSKDGESLLRSGAWIAVCEEKDGKMDSVKNTFGLLSVENLCKLDGMEAFCDALKTNPDAKIRLDSYGIKDYIVEPVVISLVDENGNVITKFERSKMPEGYDIVKADNVYVYSENREDVRSSAEDNLYNKMTMVYGGERKVNQLCKEVVSKLSYGKDYTAKSDINWGFGRLYVTDTSVSGDYSMVQVREFRYIKTVIIYVILLNVCWTLGITDIVFRKKVA